MNIFIFILVYLFLLVGSIVSNILGAIVWVGIILYFEIRYVYEFFKYEWKGTHGQRRTP